MSRNTFSDSKPSSRAQACRCVLVCVASIVLSASAVAQNHRSAWMWSTSSHPFGAANVIGDPAKENELISYFDFWGFDRIYTSVGNTPINDPTSMARWNAALDDAGMDSQTLHGLISFSPTGLANLVQTRLIDFNDSRADPREHFDGVHLDIEPHASSAWQSGTPTDRRDLLMDLRDTYVAARAQLDNNGYPNVKIYADLPVWYDSASSIGWLDANDRDQWFDDIAVALDGITLMAFERETRRRISEGVGWEVDNFNGEVRVGLNVNEVGPGDTFEDFDEMMAVAEDVELFYGTLITGIDFQPLITYTDLAPTPLSGDYNNDGTVNAADYTVWRDNLGSMTNLDADGDYSGIVDIPDYDKWKANFGATGGGSSALAAGGAIPEPASLLLCVAGLAVMVALPRSRPLSGPAA